ncbi:MAG: UDP-N-acetylglucosamine 1-carboxyvinyltransferase, partial [Parasphingopyxis sp.]
MDSIVVRGGNRLSGTVQISGAKNAVLTLMPCALLTDEALCLENLPRLADVDNFMHLLNQHGASTMLEGGHNGGGRKMTVKA